MTIHCSKMSMLIRYQIIYSWRFNILGLLFFYSHILGDARFSWWCSDQKNFKYLNYTKLAITNLIYNKRFFFQLSNTQISLYYFNYLLTIYSKIFLWPLFALAPHLSYLYRSYQSEIIIQSIKWRSRYRIWISRHIVIHLLKMYVHIFHRQYICNTNSFTFDRQQNMWIKCM